MYWVDSPWMIGAGLTTGLVFGFLLQKGGVSKYPVIVGQFLFTDYTVLKVMLTAIVVGAVGVYGLLSVGLIDGLLVKPATLLGNLVGGLIFGIGMVGLGYCPGTCVAAAGEGSRNAWFGIAGMLFGAAVFTEAYPWLKRTLIDTVDYGAVTLADVTGAPPAAVIMALGAIAVAAFYGISRVERTAPGA
jgi:uncharacterized membrane protein YedE/YeeE